MLRNIPYKYNRDDLVVELQNRLPVGSFDFVYLPMDFRSTGNFGYAFVNMTAPTFVEDFYTAFNGTYLACPGLQQLACTVTFARVQRFDANISRLLKSPIWAAPNAFDTVGSTLMELALPAIFTNGVQQPFPRPDPNRLHKLIGGRKALQSLACPPHRQGSSGSGAYRNSLWLSSCNDEDHTPTSS
ncbi:hypothetical protein FOZ62_007034 [Perkinsus olseni]|uniref:Mei2-like C-terminal RNA recognition motif domain-containing protein n=1 Tax=Perkinsus olseni TaxID=32597 RepID=A0A7J6UCC3_PEROL|nr:hypothetical protein FOZ62_007034 [Perkinsus olseni]